MNPLLKQFIQESKDFLQGISEKLLQLERHPEDSDLITELFRLVHTLKGNSGLFEFPDMTKVLHASEDLLDSVRDGQLRYSADIADELLDAIDLIGIQIDEIEDSGVLSTKHLEAAAEISTKLRAYLPAASKTATTQINTVADSTEFDTLLSDQIQSLSEADRMVLWQAAVDAELFCVRYTPESECFFKGEDPFFLSRQTPGLIFGQLSCPVEQISADYDCYQSRLTYTAWAVVDRPALVQHFRYVPEQIQLSPIPKLQLIFPVGDKNGGPVYGDFVEEAVRLIQLADWEALSVAFDVMLDISATELWLASALRWAKLLLRQPEQNQQALLILIRSLNELTPPLWSEVEQIQSSTDTNATQKQEQKVTAAQHLTVTVGSGQKTLEQQELIQAICAVQRLILSLPANVPWSEGRRVAAMATLQKVSAYLGVAGPETLSDSVEFTEALKSWLDGVQLKLSGPAEQASEPYQFADTDAATPALAETQSSQTTTADAAVTAVAEEAKFGRRSDDNQAGKVLKVDQVKVDRLMDLIGEMVVAKNSLPYLANRAEEQFGVRELAKEIKSQYSVIDRIAEEMQDAIMQIRMMPVSFIFQRFPRLVRDLSRKLGKEVELVLEGEETEADKNIIEALADPLIHIVRNSLDHGLEARDVRLAAGKPAAGRLVIRAAQESDRVIIEIIDDGKGIDPEVIKRKAYEKGLIDESQLERMSDKDAVNLVFAAGFSTADKVSDLSGRGVGMDVVRSALENVGGTVNLFSDKGKGTTLRLALPLSMAVTNVMIIESDKQIFGIPMDLVVETVRLPKSAIQSIKQTQTTVLRDKIIPLLSLNSLLALDADPVVNEDNEHAALVVRIGSEQVGLIVDDFNEVIDVILKPLPGELSKLSCYAGSALLGDGSVLMVLNPRGLL